MTRYIVDFEVCSALLLRDDGSKLKWHHPDGSFEVHLSNTKLDPEKLEQFLSVQVIIHADEIRAAEKLAVDRLLTFLERAGRGTSYHGQELSPEITWICRYLQGPANLASILVPVLSLPSKLSP